MVYDVVTCKLSTNSLINDYLTETAIEFSRACNHILPIVVKEKSINKVKIQHLVYKNIRNTFKLSANMTIRVISRVIWSVKSARTRNKVVKKFKSLSMDYDKRLFTYFPNKEIVSLNTIYGRINVPLCLGKFQRDHLKNVEPTFSNIITKNKKWYINFIIKKDKKVISNITNTIGVDLGIYNIAVTSTGKFFSGKKIKHRRELFVNRRKVLQKLGTKGAKGALIRLSGKESRYMKDVNHCISKKIVLEAQNKQAIITLENINNIKQKIKGFNKKLNRMLSSWAFAQLSTFIKYKAEKAGIEVVVVLAKNTSITCPKCKTENKHSRKGAHFQCISCGYRLAADLAAARTIAGKHACPVRATVNWPMVENSIHNYLSTSHLV